MVRHAELFHERGLWHIRALERTAGLREDGASRKEFVLAPGVEIGIGTTTLVAESEHSIALREFCARLLGWGRDRMAAIDHALRAIRLAAARRSTLVLRAEEDQVPIAHALHRRVLGDSAPFVVCDPRRGEFPPSVRSPANLRSAMMAFQVAACGSVCVRSGRLPRDLPELLTSLDDVDHQVQLIVCMSSHERSGFPTCPTLIEVPPLGIRRTELPRIIQAYAEDALTSLCAEPCCFSDEDHDWVMAHGSTSLSEIEKATLRIVALNKRAPLAERRRCSASREHRCLVGAIVECCIPTSAHRQHRIAQPDGSHEPGREP